MEFEIYSGAMNDWRWRLRAGNGKIIADSGEGYSNREDCEHGIVPVANVANTTVVQDLPDGSASAIGAKTNVGQLALKHR